MELKQITAELLNESIEAYWQKEADKQNEGLKRAAKSIRASSIGDCARKIYYKMVEPEETIPWYNPGILKIFKDGNLHEKDMERLFEDMGFDVTKQQMMIDNHPEFKKANITGHCDWVLSKAGYEDALGEAKSLNMTTATKTRKAEDFKNSYWAAKYIDQAQCYMYGLGFKRMVFILKNKNNSDVKCLPDMELDLQHVRGLIEKAHFINACVRDKEPPPRIEYDAECANCPFEQYCLPDMSFTEAVIFGSTEILEILDERESLKEAFSRYKKLDGQSKAILKKCSAEEIFLPGYRIKRTEINKEAYEVKASQSFRFTIKKL